VITVTTRSLFLLACAALLCTSCASAPRPCAAGWTQLDLNNPEAALSLFEQDLTENDRIGSLHAGRARALHLMGRHDQAAAAYVQALQLQGDKYQWHIGHGNTQLAQGKPREAFASYSAAIELKAFSARAFYNRGLARAQLGDNAGAISDYSQSLVFNPDFAEALNSRGVSWAAQQEWPAAVNDFSLALAHNPLLTEAYGNRAAAHYAQGQAELALQDLNDGIRINRNNPQLYISRGRVLLDLELFADAASDLERALVLTPGNPAVWDDLKRARQGTPADHALASGP